MAQTPTPTAQLVGLRLGSDVVDWIKARQSEGWSFARCAAEVYRETGIYVTAESLRRWTRDAA